MNIQTLSLCVYNRYLGRRRYVSRETDNCNWGVCRNSIPTTFTSSIVQTSAVYSERSLRVHDVKVVGMEVLHWQAGRRHIIWILYEDLVASSTSCYINL